MSDGYGWRMRGGRRTAWWRTALAVTVLTGACGDATGGPGTGTVALALRPSFAAGTHLDALSLVIDNVHVTVYRPASEQVVTDETAPFNVDAQEIRLTVRFDLEQPSETLYVVLELRAGSQVLFAGGEFVAVRAGGGSTAPVLIPLGYIGPGANVAALTISPRDTTLTPGASAPFDVSAIDSAQAPVTSFYAGWSTSDTALATVNAAGLLSTVASRNGTVYLRARTPTGVADSVQIILPTGGAAQISGTVRDGATNAVIAGATLDLKAGASATANDPTLRSATSDQNGRYTIGGLAPGDYTLFATATGFLSGIVPGITLAGGQSRTIDVAMSPGQIQGTVRDLISQTVIGGVLVELKAGLNADDSDPNLRTTTTDQAGRYVIDGVPPGDYSLVWSAAGYVANHASFTLAAGQVFTINPLLPRTFLYGQVRNAVTGALLAGATVQLKAGVNATAGDPVLQSATTDQSGFYFFFPDSGGYTLFVQAAGLLTGRVPGITLARGETRRLDVALSPPQPPGSTRIILSWGPTPPDLDAYLTVPDTIGGPPTVVFYGAPGASAQYPFATLDQDVTGGLGPETITIHQQLTGAYRFSVHDYTTWADTTSNDTTSTVLANSAARVDIYQNDQVVASYAVPNAPGVLWTVFELNGATITPINTIGSGLPPGSAPPAPPAPSPPAAKRRDP